MEVSAFCVSNVASSSILHSSFSDQSHLQFYRRSKLFAPAKLCLTLPCRSVPSCCMPKSTLAPLQDLGVTAVMEPTIEQALMKELADLKLQMKQKKKELKAQMKGDKKKVQIEKVKKMKQKDVSEGKGKMKKCSADSSSSSSESSDGECETVSMKMLRNGQVGEVSALKDCMEKSAGLLSTVCASCKDDTMVVCGGSSSNVSILGHDDMERFTVKSMTSRVIEGQDDVQSHGSMMSGMLSPCRNVLGSRSGSTSNIFPTIHASNRIEVCAGGKCKKAGSEQLLSALRGHLLGTSNVEVVPCKCMGKCSMGINVRVHKEDTSPQHHSHVGVEDATLILGHHFGHPLSGLPSLSSRGCTRAPPPLVTV